jgi:hypothetical protein
MVWAMGGRLGPGGSVMGRSALTEQGIWVISLIQVYCYSIQFN